MFDRLHGLRTLGPAIDARLGPAPFNWLIDEFRRGDSGLRDRMTEVLRRFLGDVGDLQVWPASARDNLLDVIQDCGEELVDDIRRLVRMRALLDQPAAGVSAHGGLLKCLLSLRHYGTPEFWLDQYRIIGPKSGALIFTGLIEHGLDTATVHLPELCADAEACRYIMLTIPVLQDRFGTAAVTIAFQKQFSRLNGPAIRLFAAVLTRDPETSARADEPSDVVIASNDEIRQQLGWQSPSHVNPGVVSSSAPNKFHPNDIINTPFFSAGEEVTLPGFITCIIATIYIAALLIALIGNLRYVTLAAFVVFICISILFISMATRYMVMRAAKLRKILPDMTTKWPSVWSSAIR
jgi:hypothetical protein